MNDKKLIIDAVRHNCSHCGTKSAKYENIKFFNINESDNKILCAMFIECAECNNVSMHLLKTGANFDSDSVYVSNLSYASNGRQVYPVNADELNNEIIMSIPTPTFIIDSNIPANLRNLLIEAGKCIKENALTGASACIRKAIYEFLNKEKTVGNDYNEKIKSIKNNWPQLTDYLDVLKGIKGIASDQVHEDSSAKFSSQDAQTYIAILEEIFREVYVIPQQRNSKKQEILKKFSVTDKEKKEKQKLNENYGV